MDRSRRCGRRADTPAPGRTAHRRGCRHRSTLDGARIRRPGAGDPPRALRGSEARPARRLRAWRRAASRRQSRGTFRATTTASNGHAGSSCHRRLRPPRVGPTDPARTADHPLPTADLRRFAVAAPEPDLRGRQRSGLSPGHCVRGDRPPRLALAASWTALEDIKPGSGELTYFDGSHRLPDFVFSDEFKCWHRDRDGDEMHVEYLAGLVTRSEASGLPSRRHLAAPGRRLHLVGRSGARRQSGGR